MRHLITKTSLMLSMCVAAAIPMAGLNTQKEKPVRKPVTYRNPATKLMRPLNGGPERVIKPAKFIKANSAVKVPEILGSEVYLSYDPGIFSLTWNESAVFTLIAEGPNATGGGVLVDDTYYCVNNIYGTTLCAISSFDASTWEQNWSYALFDMECYAHDMTYDPVDKKIYGCFMKMEGEDQTCEDRFAWGVLDTENQTRTELGEMNVALAAVAADKNGEIYGLDYEGILYSVNKTDGTLTRLADTSLKSKYATGGIIDKKSGKMLYITQPEDGYPALYSISLPGGETELLGNFDNYQQLRGLFLPKPLAEDGAPAEPTDLRLQFSGNALFGIFNATMPSMTYGGDPLSGELTCTVSLDGEVARTFTTYPGETLYEFMEIPAPGMHTFSAKVANAEGESPAAEITQWIGADELTPVKNVRLTLEGDMASLTWDAPEPVHGGYYDPELLTYDVTRLPDEVKVAKDALFNVYMGMLPETEGLTMWKFRVDAIYDGEIISSAESNSIKTGSDVTPPFSTSFDSQEEFDLFTVINSNNDGFQWQWSNFYGAEKCASIKYNLNEAMNDWLISPGLKLQGGKNYKVSYLAYCAGSNYPERLEVAYGNAATAEAMTSILVPPTEIRDEISSAVKTSVMLTPEADGTYYIGFHGISDAGMFFLYLDDFSIAEATGKTPAAVTDLVAEADNTVPNRVRVTFTTPTVDENGDALSELTSVSISRNGKTIRKFDNPETGKAFEYTDEEAPEGTNVYSVTCYNSEGEGPAATASAYVGEDEPGRVTEVTVTESEKGKFTVSWKAPATGLNGGYVNPDNLTYYIARVNTADGTMTTIERYSKATEITDEFNPEKQTVFAYSIRAENAYGYSRWTTTDSFVAGPGLSYPFSESITGGMAANANWISERINGESEWYVAERGIAPDCAPQDNDGGMFEFVGLKEGDISRLASGAIDVTPDRKPQLTFWYYAAGDNRLILEASADNRPWKEMFVTDLAQTPKNGWTKAIVDLTDIEATHSLRIAFKGETHDTSASIYVDNIQIKDAASFNLGIASYESPAEVTVGNDMSVSAVIENTGTDDAENAKAELYRKDMLVDTFDIPTLKAGEKTTVTLSDATDPAFGSEEAYFIKVNYDKDLDDSDNQEYFRVRVTHNLDFPVPTDLKATTSGKNVSLTWNAPDAYNGTTESFENYEPFGFLDRIGAWTTLNRTGSEKIRPVDGSSSIDYPTSGYAIGFQVFNASEAGMRSHDLDARDGAQILVSFAAKVGANDDWLISPELSGETQNISFFAKGASQYFPEKFEVLYSTSTSDPLAFTVIGETEEVNASWKEFDIELPEGTRYFAIRYCSFDCYGLMLDGISFDSRARDAKLAGYRIYRDGKAIGTVTTDDLTFGDTLEEGTEAAYTVTAVYDSGESPFSNMVKAGNSAVNDLDGECIRVIAHNGKITVSGAEGMTVRVYNQSGLQVCGHICGATETISVDKGIYIVRIDERMWKVII